MSKYFIGVDIGGTTIKSSMFDEHGSNIAVSTKHIQLHTPAPGHTERDPHELYDLVLLSLRDVVTKASVNSVDILGLSCTGHGKGLYLWGKDDKPLGRAIISTDSRAADYVKKWYADGTYEKVYEKTMQEILACQPCALLAWLKDNKPKSYKNIKWVFEAKDYVRFLLTGEAFGEITDYSGTNLVNLKTNQYDEELLNYFGLSEIKEALPKLVSSFDQCGTITREVAEYTGLPEGLPVAGGMFDIDACAIATGIKGPEGLCVIVGTWGINEYISKNPVLNGSIPMNSRFCIPDYFLIETATPNSASNLEWAIRNIFNINDATAKDDIYNNLNSMVSNVKPDESEIIFLPYVFSSSDNFDAKACFIGMMSCHNQSHMVRAVYEGIVFSHYRRIKKLLLNREAPQVINLAGGAANSIVWSQMFADIIGIPVRLIPVKELGTLGCAINCAVTLGTYKTIEEAIEHMVPSGKEITPNFAARKIYMKKYELFEHFSNLLYPEQP